MSEIMTLDANIRETSGKASATASRTKGFIPGVVYGEKKDPISIEFDSRWLQKNYSSAFYSHLVDLKIDGKSERVIPRDIQRHPVSDRPIHIDFLRVNKDSVLHVFVPLSFINEELSPGIKRGGVLNTVVHELEVSCPATHIPEKIEIDMTGMEIHDTVHLTNISLPSDVTPLHPERDNTIATIVAPSSVRSEAAEGEGEVEGETPATAPATAETETKAE
jgi:large subunit ribosomal protein L25